MSTTIAVPSQHPGAECDCRRNSRSNRVQANDSSDAAKPISDEAAALELTRLIDERLQLYYEWVCL